MSLLSWDGINEGPSSMSLREVIENMRQAGALGEMLGRLFEQPQKHADSFDQDLAVEFMCKAGSLVQALGARARDLLDAQAAPAAPLTPEAAAERLQVTPATAKRWLRQPAARRPAKRRTA